MAEASGEYIILTVANLKHMAESHALVMLIAPLLNRNLLFFFVLMANPRVFSGLDVFFLLNTKNSSRILCFTCFG